MRNYRSGKNVVSMSMYKGEMQFPLVKEVEAYWQGLREGEIVPLRSAIDPRGIERALEYSFVIERIAPGVARFRLSGMHLNDVMGMEVRGMPLTAFFTPSFRKDVSARLEEMFQGPKIAEMTLTAERGIGKPPMDAKLLMLPLRSDLGDISRALGCLVTIGQIGRTPRRFDLESVRMTPLAPSNTRCADNDAPVMVPVTQRDVPGFADPAAPFDGPPTAPQERAPFMARPMLRVVRSVPQEPEPAAVTRREDLGRD